MGQRLLKPTHVNHSWIRPTFHTPSSRDHESVKLCTCGILAKHGKPSPPQVNSFFGVACKSSNFHRAEGSRFSPIALFGSPMFPVERLQHAAPHSSIHASFGDLNQQPHVGNTPRSCSVQPAAGPSQPWLKSAATACLGRGSTAALRRDTLCDSLHLERAKMLSSEQSSNLSMATWQEKTRHRMQGHQLCMRTSTTHSE